MTILVTVAVLGILSVIGLTFVGLSRGERIVSANYADHVGAQLLAASGVHWATVQLKEKAFGKTALFSSPGTPVSQAWDRPDETWVYRHNEPDFEADPPRDVGHGIPIENALLPSFHQPSLSPPASRAMPTTTYRPDGDYLVLKILDTSSQLNVNMDHPKLADMLVALGETIAFSQGTVNPIPNLSFAQELLAYRDSLVGKRFASKRQLQGFSKLTRKAYEALEDFVSVQGWLDEDVIAPNPSGSFRDPLALEQKPRVAVNINTAPFPVLVAALSGLSGRAQRFVGTGSSVFGTEVAEVQTGQVPPISTEGARKIAREIIRKRNSQGGFKSWSDFDKFVGELAGAPNASEYFGFGNTQEKAAVLLANANPNTRLNRFVPVAPLYKAVDKADLLYYTTEFSFSNDGFFEIQSLGRILASNGDRVAEARVTAVVHFHDILRHSTQEEFRAAASFFSPNSQQVVAGPEPYWLNAQGVHTDGHVQLSTEWTASSNGAGSATPGFFAPYRGSFDAEGSVGGSGVAVTAKDTGGLLSGGELAPDGVLCWRESPEQLEYSSSLSNNIPSDAGAMEFWIKLPTPPSVGSDEVIVHATRLLQTDPQFEGITWRLERFGQQLLSTRFYWGHPDAAKAPANFEFGYTDWSADISTWLSHEWHHIAVAWFNGTNQAMWVDGKPATKGVQILPQQTQGSQTLVNRFDLRSSLPQSLFFFGGFDFTPALGGTLFKIDRPIEAGYPVARFSHAVLDDLRTYTSAGVFGDPNAPLPFCLPDRYRILSGSSAPVWEGAFVPGTPLDDPAPKLGVLRWTVAYPPTRLNACVASPQRVSVIPNDLPVKVFGRTVGQEFGDPLHTGLETTGQPPVGAGVTFAEKKTPQEVKIIADFSGRVFFYRFVFEKEAAFGPTNVAPTIDDVTLTVVFSRPKILEWYVDLIH